MLIDSRKKIADMGEVTKVYEKMRTSFMFGPSLKEGGYLIIFEKSID